MMLDPSLPASLPQVEALILSLYEPNTPERIATIQAALSHLQGESAAWNLARQLLARPDDKVRFFGALTIIIKINKESSSLNDESAIELLVELISWYLRAIESTWSALVTQKLASALSTFFIHFPELWPNCILHLIVCIATQTAVSPKALPDMDNVVEQLSPRQTHAALLAMRTFLDDTAKIDLNSAHNSAVQSALLNSVRVAVELMTKALDPRVNDTQICSDSIKGIMSWADFNDRASVIGGQIKQFLHPLVSHVITILPQPSLHNASVGFLNDILNRRSDFLSTDQYGLLQDVLCNAWAQDRLIQFTRGDIDFEAAQFMQLLLYFATAKVEKLVVSPDAKDQHILNMLCNLVTTKGYPVCEDGIFVPAVEFWCSFAESITDLMYWEEECDMPWINAAKTHAISAVSHIWQRIQLPPAIEYAEWDSTDRSGFLDARRDVVDLLQTTFTVSGPQLVTTFAELILDALEARQWLRLEAAVYCLGGLADCVKDDGRCDDSLAMVFSSQLMPLLQSETENVPVAARQTCVSLIEHYKEYFQRHVELLPSALSLLFSGLTNSSTATTASKSILKLCSECRQNLHAEIDALAGEYQKLVSSKSLDCLSSERVLGAIAAVAQAIPDEKRRLDACEEILAFVYHDAQLSKALVTQSGATSYPCHRSPRCFVETASESLALHVGLRALESLVAVARSFQTAEDGLDVTGDDFPRHTSDFDDHYRRLQRQVIEIFATVQQTFGTNNEVFELICNVLRCGFSETEPGPFVLPADDVAHYIAGHGINTPRVGILIRTASSFVSSLHARNMLDRRDLLNGLLLWVIELIKGSPYSLGDPELTQNAIDFVNRLFTKKPQVFLQLSPSDATEFFMLFTLQVLEGSEPLPKAAAADFWATFVSLRSDELGVQEAMEAIMITLGPRLTQSIARNIGGRASRSELDKLSEPLKKLVARYPRTRDWLKQGLNDSSFPESNATQADKDIFLKKVIHLRGARMTNSVVRDFWLVCRGSSFAYAS